MRRKTCKFCKFCEDFVESMQASANDDNVCSIAVSLVSETVPSTYHICIIQMTPALLWGEWSYFFLLFHSIHVRVIIDKDSRSGRWGNIDDHKLFQICTSSMTWLIYKHIYESWVKSWLLLIVRFYKTMCFLLCSCTVLFQVWYFFASRFESEISLSGTQRSLNLIQYVISYKVVQEPEVFTLLVTWQ